MIRSQHSNPSATAQKECPISRAGSSRCSVLTVALCLIAGAWWPTNPASAGPIIAISNRTKNAERYTDLIAYEKNAAGNVVNKKVILPPGNPNDGVLLQPNQAMTYDTGFEPTDILVSASVGKNEFETKLFKVLQITSKEIGFLSETERYNPGLPRHRLHAVQFQLPGRG